MWIISVLVLKGPLIPKKLKSVSSSILIIKDKTLFQVYDNKYWSKDENIGLAKTARKKITEFYKGERSPENTFDLEKMAAFFAVLDATYTTHALFYNSKL